jgi:hypothetical protein
MESSLVGLLLVLVLLFVLYWLIRLGVSHGVQDAARKLTEVPAAAQVRETIRRQRARHGDEQA